MTEIEIKARLADAGRCEQTVSGFARFLGETRKLDVYWQQDTKPHTTPAADSNPTTETPETKPPVRLRLRDENGSVTVTYKRKELRAEMEINDEQEFTVSDRAAFEILLKDLGFKVYSLKEKLTRSYRFDEESSVPVTIELSAVRDLGAFIELEILIENPDEETIARAGKKLRATLSRCGIPESAIESRFYNEMLAEKGLNGVPKV